MSVTVYRHDTYGRVIATGRTGQGDFIEVVIAQGRVPNTDRIYISRKFLK